MIVILKAPYVAPGGATCYPGEKVFVPDDAAARLIAQRAAEPWKVKPAAPEAAATANEATLDPANLRGEAKKNWLRWKIAQVGATPVGNTIKALAEQLAALTDNGGA